MSTVGKITAKILPILSFCPILSAVRVGFFLWLTHVIIRAMTVSHVSHQTITWTSIALSLMKRSGIDSMVISTSILKTTTPNCVWNFHIRNWIATISPRNQWVKHVARRSIQIQFASGTTEVNLMSYGWHIGICEDRKYGISVHNSFFFTPGTFGTFSSVMPWHHIKLISP